MERLPSTADNVDALADMSLDMELGARGLRGIIESKLLDLQYNITKFKNDGVTQVIIDKRFLESDDTVGSLVYEKETKTT